MADKQPDRNDQASTREDRADPGIWPGSGTTVEGPVDTATSGILAESESGSESGSGGARTRSASTSAEVQEPEDRRAEQ